MSDTAQRLAAYKASELRILKAQSLGHGDRTLQNAQLSEVRAAIKELEAQLAAENRANAGSFGPVTLLSSFSRPLG